MGLRAHKKERLMKSSKVVIAMLAVLVTGSAYAAYTDIGNVVTEETALQKVKTTVKVTVQNVLDYWYGKKEAPVTPPTPEEPKTSTGSVAEQAPADSDSDKAAPAAPEAPRAIGISPYPDAGARPGGGYRCAAPHGGFCASTPASRHGRLARVHRKATGPPGNR